MTIETWPAAFPQKPLADPTSFGLVTPVEQAETEHLLPLQRQRSGTTAVRWQVAWRFDAETGGSLSQWRLFSSWVRHKLDGATLPFYWPVWIGDGYVNRLTYFDGDPLAAPRVAGLAVFVTARLIVIDPPVLSEGALDIALSAGGG